MNKLEILQAHLDKLNAQAQELQAVIIENVGEYDISHLLRQRERVNSEKVATVEAIEQAKAAAENELSRVKSKEYLQAVKDAEKLERELMADKAAIEKQAQALQEATQAWQEKGKAFQRLNRKHKLNMSDIIAKDSGRMGSIQAMRAHLETWLKVRAGKALI